MCLVQTETIVNISTRFIQCHGRDLTGAIFDRKMMMIGAHGRLNWPSDFQR